MTGTREGDAEPAEVLLRPTARLVLLDEQDRLLLFHAALPSGAWLWFPPGGGVEPGETYEQAARRELWEETGLRVELGPWIWTRELIGELPDPAFAGAPVRFVERYYLVRTHTFAPRPQQIGEYESYMEAAGWWSWWTLEGIGAAVHETFVPRRLAQLLPQLLAGELPDRPIDVSDEPRFAD